MCDTCPSHIPGPGEVASGALGLAVGAAISRPGRRILFWGVCVPALPFAVVGVFGWWTIALVALAAVLAGAGVAYMRFLMKRHVLIAAPASLRASLPAPRRVRAVALPRNLSITRKRPQVLPAPARVIEPTRVIAAELPARRRS